MLRLRAQKTLWGDLLKAKKCVVKEFTPELSKCDEISLFKNNLITRYEY